MNLLENGQKYIVVVSHGFVYVGEVAGVEGGLVVTNARNIRRWGTTEGLGELRNGPTEDTVLDQVGTVRIPLHSLVHLIDVAQNAW